MGQEKDKKGGSHKADSFPCKQAFWNFAQNVVIWTNLAAKEGKLLFWAVLLLAENWGSVDK